MEELRIGVVGYSAKEFDTEEATEALDYFLDEIENEYQPESVALVSGLTDQGIPSLAYEAAELRGYRLVGVAPAEAKHFDCYDVDEEIIIGDDFGDESHEFIMNIDVLIRIGGGKQSEAEQEMAQDRGIPVYEYDL